MSCSSIDTPSPFVRKCFHCYSVHDISTLSNEFLPIQSAPPGGRDHLVPIKTEVLNNENL
jgi:hypothetical protein